jgi:hypothetical protein
MAGTGKDEWPLRPMTCLSPIRSESLLKATDQTDGHPEVEYLFWARTARSSLKKADARERPVSVRTNVG